MGEKKWLAVFNVQDYHIERDNMNRLSRRLLMLCHAEHVESFIIMINSIYL